MLIYVTATKKNATLGEYISMVWKIGHIGKYRRNAFKNCKMLCRKRNQKTSWTDRVKNEVLNFPSRSVITYK